MLSSRRFSLTMLALLGAALLAPRIASADNDTYTVTDLGTLTGKANSWTWTQVLNNRGAVAAYANDNPPNPNAFVGDLSFLWDGGTITALHGLPGATDTVAISLNDHNTVVGISGGDSWQTHAVVWENGTVRDLGTLPGDLFSWGWNVNNRGQIVGYSFSLPWHERGRAFLWERGKMHPLLPLPGFSGDNDVAISINEKGQIVGASGPSFESPVYATLWENGNSTPIALGAYGSGLAINDKTQVTGIHWNADFSYAQAFFWEKGELTLLASVGVGPVTLGTDINNHGQIVGVSLDDFTDVTHSTAILWENKTPIDLNLRIPFGSGWKLLAASGINERGQIAGYGVHNGAFRAFLLTPRKK